MRIQINVRKLNSSESKELDAHMTEIMKMQFMLIPGLVVALVGRFEAAAMGILGFFLFNCAFAVGCVLAAHDVRLDINSGIRKRKST